VRDAHFPRYAAFSIRCHLTRICCGRVGHERRPQRADPERSVADFPQTRRRHGVQQRLPCSWPPNAFIGIQEATTREIWHSADTADVIDLPLDGAAMAGARPTGKFYTPEQRVTREAGRRRLYAWICVRRVRRQPSRQPRGWKIRRSRGSVAGIFSVPPVAIGKTDGRHDAGRRADRPRGNPLTVLHRRVAGCATRCARRADCLSAERCFRTNIGGETMNDIVTGMALVTLFLNQGRSWFSIKNISLPIAARSRDKDKGII